MKIIKFPDSETSILPALKTILEANNLSNYRIATQRHPEGFSGAEIIFRVDGSTISDRVLKEQDMALTIYVNNGDFNTRYATANKLSLILEAGLPLLPKISLIKSVFDINTSAIIDPQGELEVRYITFTVLLIGETLELPI